MVTMTKMDRDMVQEILISVIGATVFSYFLGESLTLFTLYTSMIYPSAGLTWGYLWRFAEAYGPPAVFAFIDVALFVLLFQKLFWKHLEKRNEQLNGLWWFFAQMFRLFPSSTVPWPFQHIFTAYYLEPERQAEQIVYLPIWLVVSLSLVVFAYLIEWRLRKSS